MTVIPRAERKRRKDVCDEAWGRMTEARELREIHTALAGYTGRSCKRCGSRDTSRSAMSVNGSVRITCNERHCDYAFFTTAR